jgi:single-stranded-DNA-specific exonuclease
VVPLTGLNRAYVVKGLQIMRLRRNIGLKALSDAAGLAVPPTPYHLGFVLGPRINAGGRIGDSGLGARLLATEDAMETARIAVLLDKLNRERKAIEAAMLEEAVARADRLLEADPDVPLLLVAAEGWHKGVVGLIASRLVERFQRPACVIGWDGRGEGTGSLRSIDGVDIGRAVRAGAAAGILKKGGGHAMAAGLTLARNRYEELEAFLRAELASATEVRRRAMLDLDGALTAGAVCDELIAAVDAVGPYGAGNPQPRFAFPAHRIRFAKVVGEAHVRCVLEAADGSRLDAVAFRAAGQPLGAALLGAEGMPLHLAGHLRRDTWNGRNRRELLIEDAADPRRQGP